MLDRLKQEGMILEEMGATHIMGELITPLSIRVAGLVRPGEHLFEVNPNQSKQIRFYRILAKK